MDPFVHLLVHNIAIGISGLLALALAFFTFVNNPRRPSNITLALAFICVVIFIFSHIIGVNTIDSDVSRSIFMFNTSTIFLVIFNMHCILSVIGITKSRRPVLVLFYGVGIALTIFYIIFPDLFLLPSVPKMYFLNYYEPGMYHWVMRIIFNAIVPIYSMIELAIAYKGTEDALEKRRYTYFFWASVVGYSIGSIPIFLVYNIAIDPAWGAFFVIFYAVPFLYAVVEYQLLEIKIIAKRAFFYALSCIAVGGFIVLFEFANSQLIKMYPGFPFWVTPLISSILVVSITFFIWRKLRENDVLKYEFITTVTHKFRTPLTYVKWSTESLLKENLSDTAREQVKYIEDANTKLVELTNLLSQASEQEDKDYGYKNKEEDLTAIVTEVIASVKSEFTKKNITFVENIEPNVHVVCDRDRVKFVVQVLIENALHYTKEQGSVSLLLETRGKNAVFLVKDSGIGITKENLSLIFSKFYRREAARLAETEGLGIGLFLAKEIMIRHQGNVTAESEGQNMGSTFTMSLPKKS